MFLFAALTAPAFGGIPDPARSTVPPCLVLCPAGDVTYTVVVRDIAGNPVSGAVVRLSFVNCMSAPFISVCSLDCCPGVIVDGLHSEFRTTTDVNGVARFPLMLGGSCTGATFGVSADGVVLVPTGVPLAAFDQDGNLTVNAADAALVQAAIGTVNPGADFTCDGLVTQADLDLLNGHLGHSCAGVVPTRATTWGTVKIIYR